MESKEPGELHHYLNLPLNKQLLCILIDSIDSNRETTIGKIRISLNINKGTNIAFHLLSLIFRLVKYIIFIIIGHLSFIVNSL